MGLPSSVLTYNQCQQSKNAERVPRVKARDTYAAGARAHKVNRQAAAVIAGAGARAVPGAENLADLSRVRVDDGARAVDGALLARADRRDRRGREAASARAGHAALEVGGAGAQAGERGAAALRGEAAVAAAAARRLGAALDVVRRARARVADVLAAAGAAARGRDADARRAARSRARPVHRRALDQRGGRDGAGAEEGAEGDDGAEMHGAGKLGRAFSSGKRLTWIRDWC